jgi:1-phosphatidylinositol-4-phosphate 5-kinase
MIDVLCSLVDILLALLYIFEYCVTEFKTEAVSLPFRIAAITQALLVCGEFWFFAMPIDLLQSITNPFTSYSHNIRVYWFYSTLSGAVCGIALWYLDGATGCGNSSDCAEVEKKENRYFWFHYNTEINGFFWHRWISYHVWVLVYLFFGAFCILYVRR